MWKVPVEQLRLQDLMEDVARRGEEIFVKSVLPIEQSMKVDVDRVLQEAYTMEELYRAVKEERCDLYMNFTSSSHDGLVRTIMGECYYYMTAKEEKLQRSLGRELPNNIQTVMHNFLPPGHTVGYVVRLEGQEWMIDMAVFEADGTVHPLYIATFERPMQDYIAMFVDMGTEYRATV